MSSVANLFSDLVLSSTSLACKLNASCVCVVVVSKLVSLCLVEVLSWLVLGVVAFFFFFFFSFFFSFFFFFGCISDLRSGGMLLLLLVSSLCFKNNFFIINRKKMPLMSLF